jgi:hypothetical protein
MVCRTGNLVVNKYWTVKIVVTFVDEFEDQPSIVHTLERFDYAESIQIPESFRKLGARLVIQT